MGDDLGGDDYEYLSGKVRDDDDYDFAFDKDKKKSVLEASTVAVIDEDDDDDIDGNNSSSKRKRKEKDADDSEEAKKAKQPKQAPSRSKLLIEASRNIEQDPSQKQAAFLWTSLVHHHQLQSSKKEAGKDEKVEEELDETTLALEPKLQAHHFIASQLPTMEARLRECMPSKKQLKNWRQRQSPCVVIVCLSARRAVAVLKEISIFKVRAAKLFAKHMQVKEQTEWLATTPFPIAVGTPHRLQQLCEKGALKLTHTKLVVLDAHKDSKSFTVCTLPDTAPHCSEFLREQVLPAIKSRPKEMKIAFC